MDIELREPIDGINNSYYITRKVHLQPNTPTDCHIGIDDWGYLRFSYITQRTPCGFLLFEGDKTKIELHPNENKCIIGGDNAAGKEYLYNYARMGLGNHEDSLLELFADAIKDSIDFSLLDANIQKWEENRPYKKETRSLLENGKINERFYRILSDELRLGDLSLLDLSYRNAIRGRLNEYKPTQQEKEKLWQRWEKLRDDLPLLKEADLTKHYYSGYRSMYYEMKYNFLDDATKACIKNEYDSIWGYYSFMALAPANEQFDFFTTDAIYRLQDNIALYADPEKFIQWLNSDFPDKRYTAIITQLWKDRKERLSQKVEASFIDGNKIGNFKDLVQAEELKGKRLFIDLWATWCSPCLAQFKYNEQTHQVLKEKGLTPVYISVDEDKNDSLWREQIRFHKLAGYHLRTSHALEDYLKKTIYGGSYISVPRYLLIDEKGNILNNRLPLPSRLNDFKEALNVPSPKS